MLKSTFLFALSAIAWLSCNPPTQSIAATKANETGLNAVAKDSIILPSKNYSQMKQQVTKIKKSANTITDFDSLGKVFTTLLVDSIIPYWYGTPWSFEGHTTSPKTGSVACGYFVSTTLNHAGLTINRYKLAQQWPVDEALSLSLTKPLIQLYDVHVDSAAKQISEAIIPGIYFIGFGSNHVGLLYQNKTGTYLIHSNYVANQGVVKEPIAESQILASFSTFHIAELSTNEAFLKAWINNKEITVITQ